jgi:hypothetical protein
MSGEKHGNDWSGRAVGVAEAAARLGISTLRVRHRLRTGSLKGFRDNRGHWQVRVDGPNMPGNEQPLDRDALIDMLVEELLEAKDRADEQAGAIKRLHAIIVRQQELLDRAVARLEAPSAGQADPRSADKLTKALDRALAMLETSLARQEELTVRADRFRAMMERSLALLETVAPGAAPADGGRMAGTLEQAFGVANKALARAEASSHHAARLDGMVERALSIAEENAESQKRAEQRVARRDALLERTLGVVEGASSRLQGDGTSRRRVFSFLNRGPRRPAGE